MYVAVDKIHASGRVIPFDLTTEWATTAITGAVEARVTSASGSLRLRAEKQTIAVHATGVAMLCRPCDRCGEEVRVEIEVDQELEYLPEDRSPSTGEVQLQADDLDVGWYGAAGLSLAEVVSEVYALSMPVRTVCLEASDCQARTMALLHSADTEVGHFGHPAFAVLKDIC